MTKRLLPFLLAVFLVVAATRDAFAGNLWLSDGVGFLKFSELKELQAKATAWPFDAHIIIAEKASVQALEDAAHVAVDAPNVVAVAIDPVHHHVVARFGSGTTVKPGDYGAIAAAGNAHFRGGNNAGGVLAILQRANASAAATTALVEQAAPVVVESGFSTGTWMGLGAAGFVLLAIAFWIARRARLSQRAFADALEQNRLETAELRARNVEHMTMPDPGTPIRPTYPASRLATPRLGSASMPVPNIPTSAAPPGYYPATMMPVAVAPPVIVHGGGGDLATGILLGEALSRSHDTVHERVVHERVYEPASTFDSGNSYDSDPSPAPTPAPAPAPSYDSGGSSSSYGGSSSSYGDSGGSSSYGSSPSYDSGGSSSSFDAGGGGGSFDGGSSSW